MHYPLRVHFIAQRIKDIELLIKIRASGLEEKKEILANLGPFKSAVLMNLYWHLDHDDLLVLKQKLKSQYAQLNKQVKTTSE